MQGSSIAVADGAEGIRESVLDDTHDPLVELLCAVVVETRRDRGHDRELVVCDFEGFAVAAHLLANISECVVRAPTVGLVDDDHICEIQHVDLLELGRSPVFGRHHVYGDVRGVDDLRVRLADA